MILESLGHLWILVLLTSMPFQADARVGTSGGVLQDAASEQSFRGGTAGIEMLTPTEGVDFNGYLRSVYLTTKKRWFANMPPSVAKGQKGVNSVEFRILQDGTVPKEFMKVKAGSGKADLDQASLAGIREAAPFAKLPEKFTAPYIELRFTFYYNLEPPQR
jgi:TonB family protein